MKLRKSAHAVYKTEYHVVWVTKYRRKILNKGVGAYLKIKLHEISKYNPEVIIEDIGIDKDLLHIQMVIPPKYAVSRIIQKMKSWTSRYLRAKFDFLKEVYWGMGSIWSTGYFVSTVGLNEEVIRRYVQMQGKEDSGQATLELG